jgi:hypothetical protein
MKLGRRSINFIARARQLGRAVDVTSSEHRDEVCAGTIQVGIVAHVT